MKKGEEGFLTDYFLIKGEIEVFIMMENGKYTKIIDFTGTDYFVGSLTYLWKFYKEYGFIYMFKCKSNVVLKKIPDNVMEEALQNFTLNQLFFKILFERIIDLTSFLFIRSTLKGEKLIKVLLERESDNLNVVEIDNVYNFIDKYNISRSNFYKGIKKLEDNNEIEKNVNKIQIKLLGET